VIANRHVRAALRAEVNASWRHRSACKGMGRLMSDEDRVLEAKRVCWFCPVLFDCRAWVLGIKQADDSKTDVTAALTFNERRSKRASAGIARRKIERRVAP
jgi:hypothetical protein